MDISYEKFRGEKVPALKTKKLDYYYKVFRIDGVVKKSEFYIHQVLTSIEYYLDEDENELEMVAQLTPLVEHFTKIVVITKRTSLGRFTIETSREYRKTILTSKYRCLFNEFGREICTENIDINTNLPIYEKTKKYFFDGKEYEEYYLETYDGNPIFEASYHADGSLNFIWFQDPENSPQDDISYSAENFDKVLQHFYETVMDLNYFFTATFEPEL